MPSLRAAIIFLGTTASRRPCSAVTGRDCVGLDGAARSALPVASIRHFFGLQTGKIGLPRTSQTSFPALRMLNVSGRSDFGTRGRPRPRERLSREWRVTGWSERQRTEGDRRHSAGKAHSVSIRNFTNLSFRAANYTFLFFFDDFASHIWFS